MRLDNEHESRNVEDRRSGSGSGFGFPRRSRRLRLPGRMSRRGGRRGGGLGIGGLVLVLFASYMLGINPLELLSGGGGGFAPPQQGRITQDQGAGRAQTPAQDELASFTKKVLSTTERTWARIFQQKFGQPYQPPILVLFSGHVQSACGAAQSAMGPFYCPRDKRVYIDLSFFQDKRARRGAPGDFAQAYVVAHEVGHHVQNLLGIAAKVSARRMASSSRAQSNALSVRLELQADCFSGVWAHANRDLLEEGDIEEGLNAAAAIGDDRLQKRSQGYVVPESFTHGSSAERVGWFKRGLNSGDVAACDTFSR